MDPVRWSQIERLCHSALARPAAERAAYLAEACGGDEALRRELETLLASASTAEGFLAAPALDMAAQMVSDPSASLLIGRRLGVYQLLERIGAGGMGEVYRARDTRLGRDVAIKILPRAFTADPERLARFEREARVLAALNHPNIATIHGIEESDGIPALVMEMVAGETLAERIARSSLPMAEALGIARQIAEALESAHDKGIVHRDLKPANVKITPAGGVKVLDFGLAKAIDDGTAQSVGPTITVDATDAGRVVGTAAYMSPEQARGQPIDKRTDIWALGCVMYEMFSSRAAFARETVTDTLAAVVEREPDWAALPPETPVEARQLVERCLRKDSRHRLRDVGEARIRLEELSADVSSREHIGSRAPVGLSQSSALRRRFALAATLVTAAGALGIGLIWLWSREAARTESGSVTRLTFDSGLTIDPALSPDGTLVAYASDRAGEGNLDIWIQQVPGGEPVRLTRHAADERTPAFSPDGTRIAFRSERDGGGVYVMPALGGEATLFAAGGFEPRFSPDGRWISYHTGIKGDDDGAGRLRFASAKLFIVPSAGGEARQIQPTAKTATAAAWSPDSRHLLIVGSFETSNIKTSDDTGDWWVTPLEGAATRVERDSLEQREPFVRVGAPVAWLPGNRIVFPATSRDSRNQWVVTLSNRDWQIDGVPVRLTSGAGIEGPAAVSIAVGVLRLAFSTVVNNVDLWSVPLSRDGMQTSSQPFHLTLDAARELHPTLAFDGRTLIYASDRRRRRELWVRDLVTGREALLVSAPGNDLSKPVISRDGSKLAFRREQRRGQPAATSVADLSRAPDGSLRAGPPRQLPSVGKEGSGWAWSWSPSGELLWHDPAQWPTIAPNQLYDIARGERIVEFGHPTHDLAHIDFSPDGGWLAFEERFDDGNNGRLLITGVDAAGRPLPPRDWIEIATGDRSHGWHGWSPAGDVLYYESNRDGWVCIWAQRLQRETMRPAGPPVAIYHAHNARLSIGNIGMTERGFAAARDRVVFNMSEMISNIWMTEFPHR